MRIDIEILNKLGGKEIRVVMPRATVVGTLKITGSTYRVNGDNCYATFEADDVSLTRDNHCDPYAAIVVLR